MTENSSNLKKQGMTVREYVGENRSSYLVIKYKMNNMDEETYIEMFHELKRTGAILMMTTSGYALKIRTAPQGDYLSPFWKHVLKLRKR